MSKRKEFVSKSTKSIFRILAICIWSGILIFLVLNKDKITVDNIVNSTPHNTVIAVALILFMFALKSITIVVYCGFLYIACGIIFPFSIAFVVNVIGTAIMVSIPFCIGKYAGGGIVEKITKKYPKAAEIKSMQIKNDFFLSFVVRIIGLLPSDPISAYMGAIGIDYKKYIAGTMLGMLPSMITFPIMGMSITNPASPAFIISAISEIIISIISISVYYALKKEKER